MLKLIFCLTLTAVFLDIAPKNLSELRVLFGATPCNSQDNLLDVECESTPGRSCPNAWYYSKCNQNSGNGTMICNVKAGSESCKDNNDRCVVRKNDVLDKKDADGKDCKPKQLS